jgi:hypothetical protein
MLSNLKKWFNKEHAVNPAPQRPRPEPPPQPPKNHSKLKTPEKTAKELATERGEPYVAVLSMEVDLANLHQGAFDLDWNEIFIARLVKAGYMIKKDDTDAEIVDRWFQNVCRHVVMETWEQDQAINPQRYVRARNIGDGLTEVS